ncbi:TetR/AcrR family transcriptional regulator [Gloeobacter violaceus]|uniref:Gll1420 protein n=1 Tax=Gloeobacter violaceus (strain ATCC 29082 / PCC 7421) TaxID=251221 RepID=Q7NKQ7_GLOVI|nr:TetR/AcrR family transcriptional regulator [Gloeobacter violaceus]BAC89361.1 gll1420 [Gloeobacter violaceus PCC 7421]
METRKSQGVQGRPRAFNIDTALDQALLLFWRKGYLGTSLTDLTEAMGINRPSLYAAFGNKETLFRKALDRYRDQHNYRDALEEPTARRVIERMMQGVVDLVTNPGNPSRCLVTQSLLACAEPEDPLHQELAERRAAGEIAIRARFERALSEGDLPPDADPAALARFVLTVNAGLSVQAAGGASRTELLQVVQTALQACPILD